MKLRRILLTGGTGFVGKWLSPTIAKRCAAQELYQLRRSDDKIDFPGWTPIIGDLEDSASINKAIAEVKPDLVIHLGAQSSVGSALNSAPETWEINLNGSIRLASACAIHCPATNFLLVSSSEVYGTSFQDGQATEETPPRPINAYARSKLAAEMALFDILPATARLIVARPFNHTGPGQDQRFALPTFAAQIAAIEAGRQPPILKVGNINVVRDFLDVRDVVSAYIAIINHLDSFDHRNVVNIASGQAWSIATLVDKFRSRARCDFEIKVDEDRLRPSDVPRVEGASGRLQHLTGWTARIPIEETMDSLLDYWRDQVSAKSG